MRVEGLETIDYLDNLQGRERFTEQGDAITFESEVSTCVYWEFLLLIPVLVASNKYFIFPLEKRWTKYMSALQLRLRF